jgi:hypothetical protein
VAALRPAARDQRSGIAVEERVQAEAVALPAGGHAADLRIDGVGVGDAAERRADARVAEQRNQPVAVLGADRLGPHAGGLESGDGDHGSGKGATGTPWSRSLIPSS